MSIAFYLPLGNVAYGDLLRNSTVDEELYAVPSYDSKTEGAPETGAFEVPVPSLPTIDYESYAQPTTTDIPVNRLMHWFIHRI